MCRVRQYDRQGAHALVAKESGEYREACLIRTAAVHVCRHIDTSWRGRVPAAVERELAHFYQVGL